MSIEEKKIHTLQEALESQDSPADHLDDQAQKEELDMLNLYVRELREPNYSTEIRPK